MANLVDLANRYEKLENAIDEIKNGSNKPEGGIAEDIVNSAKPFLAKLNVPLERLEAKNPHTLTKDKDGRYRISGESRKIDYTYDNALEIAKEAVKTINEALKNLISDFNGRDKVRLGVALNTFYDIVDNIYSLEIRNKSANKSNQDSDLAGLEYKLNRLKKEIDEYFDANGKTKNVRELDLDEAYQEITSPSYKFSHTVDIGTLNAKFSSGFVSYLKEQGYKAGGAKLSISFKENENVYLIDVDPSFLRRNNDFYNCLTSVVLGSFTNFREKEYKVAFIEGSDGEVMLGPISDFVREASNDYVYGDDIADSEEKTARLINDINEEVRNRNRLFKTTRNIAARNIDAYNASNKENPLSYILLVIKDYPSGFNSKEIVERLQNIILEGASTGVAVLIIGKNEQINTGFSGVVEPLDIPTNHIIKAEPGTKQLVKDGQNFNLIEPNEYYDDIELMQKRLASASIFSMSSLLEEGPSIPHYEEIAVPLGKQGGDIYSLVSHTERPPYPFVLITGSTGTGKSAFLHEIILSGAYKYSPDELEFHVIDFKSATQGTEFASYQYGKELYIPHVKYLSLKSRPENALDIVNYIQKLKSARNRLGKFKQYNASNPNKKMPMIWVIIDEYESMLNGGEETDNGYEAVSLRSLIQDRVTAILKTARAFGIGLIFSGQMNGLPKGAFSQISTFITFNNKKDVISAIHPGGLDMSVFPTDDFRGLAYVSSNGATPKFTKFAWAGTPETMSKLAKTICEKYPEHTARHEQTIIGGLSNAELRLDSFLPWKEEIENRIMDEESNFESKEQFLSSKRDKIFKTLRPIALGQSSSSNTTVYLDYQKDENRSNFFAFGHKEDLCPIERNAMLSFLYQAAELQLKDKHIIFMDGSTRGVKSDIFGQLSEKYPFILKQIEYISDPVEMARKLLVLEKHMKDNKDNNPYFIVMHEIAWLNGRDFIPKVKEAKPLSKEDKSTNQDVKSSLGALASSGVAVPSFLMNANFAGASKAKEEVPVEFESFNESEVKHAFRELYMNGSLYEHFMIASSSNYANINDLVISLGHDSKAQEQIKEHSIYGSFEMLKSQAIGNNVNANICYVIDGDYGRSTTRLFDYEASEASPWWDRLEKMMFYWR